MSSTPLHVANGSIEMLIVKSFHWDNCFFQLRFDSAPYCFAHCIISFFQMGAPLDVLHSASFVYLCPHPFRHPWICCPFALRYDLVPSSVDLAPHYSRAFSSSSSSSVTLLYRHVFVRTGGYGLHGGSVVDRVMSVGFQ